MFELTTFNNDQFGEIRTVNIDCEPYLVGNDVANALGYSNPRDAIAKHVDAEDKRVSRFATPSGEQNMTVINESGLYALVFGSKLQSAKQFKRWVTSEVLPALRKTGSYTNQQNVRMSDALAAMANVARMAEENQRRIDAVEESQKAIDAKLDAAADAFTAPALAPDAWRDKARATISAIVQENSLSYQQYTGELYKSLENVAGVDLSARQNRRRSRMKKEGATYRERQDVTKLCIIDADPKLRAIFDGILREEKVSRMLKGARIA